MPITDFDKFKEEFIKGNLETKISLYINAEGLNGVQYKELLKHFPYEELYRLEKALR